MRKRHLKINSGTPVTDFVDRLLNTVFAVAGPAMVLWLCWMFLRI